MKTFALLDRHSSEIYVQMANDIIDAALAADEGARDGQVWYRTVPASRAHEILMESTYGYTVYHVPHDWRPVADYHESLADLSQYPIAGHVEITWPE